MTGATARPVAAKIAPELRSRSGELAGATSRPGSSPRRRSSCAPWLAIRARRRPHGWKPRSKPCSLPTGAACREKVLEQIREESRARRLLEAHGLPRLSLFHGKAGERRTPVRPDRGTPLAVGEPLELTVEKAVYRGLALARHEGRVIFVPRAFPGDRLRVRVASVERGFARAEIVEILEPRNGAPARSLRPRRALRRLCLPGAPLRDQLGLKRDILAETLRRAGAPFEGAFDARAEPRGGLAHASLVPLRGTGGALHLGLARGGIAHGRGPRALPAARSRPERRGAGTEARPRGAARPLAGPARPAPRRGHRAAAAWRPSKCASPLRRRRGSCRCARRHPASRGSRPWPAEGSARPS